MMRPGALAPKELSAEQGMPGEEREDRTGDALVLVEVRPELAFSGHFPAAMPILRASPRMGYAGKRQVIDGLSAGAWTSRNLALRAPLEKEGLFPLAGNDCLEPVCLDPFYSRLKVLGKNAKRGGGRMKKAPYEPFSRDKLIDRVSAGQTHRSGHRMCAQK